MKIISRDVLLEQEAAALGGLVPEGRPRDLLPLVHAGPHLVERRQVVGRVGVVAAPRVGREDHLFQREGEGARGQVSRRQ